MTAPSLELRSKITQLFEEVLIEAECFSTCLSCQRFDEATELCMQYGQRPPARVIAFGCKEYKEADDLETS